MRIKVQLVRHDKPPFDFHKVQYLQLPYSTFKKYVEALHTHLEAEDHQRKVTERIETRASKNVVRVTDAVLTSRQSVALESDEPLLWTNHSVKKHMEASVVDMDITTDLASGSRIDVLDLSLIHI